MATHYLLPCECGNMLTVTQVQAGQERICECGAKLEVPTIRGLAELEQVELAVEPTRRSWSPRQGALFVAGAFVLVAGAFITAWLVKNTPDDHIDETSAVNAWQQKSGDFGSFFQQDPHGLAANVAYLHGKDAARSAGESLALWSLYRDARPYVINTSAVQRAVDRKRASYKTWTWLAAGLSGLMGLALIGAALFGTALFGTAQLAPARATR